MLRAVIDPFISFVKKAETVGNALSKWWLRFGSRGSEHIIDEQEKESYIKINQFGALMTAILIFFIPVFHFFALPNPDLRITIGIALYAGLNWLARMLNKKWKKTKTAAWTLYLTTCGAVAYFGIMMGHYINLQFMVFFMLAITFQIFTSKSSRFLAVVTALAVLGILQWSYLYYPPFVYLDPIEDAGYIKTIGLLAMYSVLVVVLLTTWPYVVSKDKSHKLLKSNRHIKTYMAHVTHEVRSPINAIGLLTKRMHREIMNNPKYAELEAYAQMLNMASLNAQQVISNVLTLSEIEAGKPEPNIIETFNVKQFFSKLISVSTILAQKKNIRIHLLFDQVPSLITSDPHKISHIVNNLLSNAIKFGTRKSTVTITIDCNERTGKWTIVVKNQGKPIPPEKMNALYEPFVRGLNGVLVPESSGLGLFITNHKVKALGGEIIADCKDGFTYFTVTLPMQLGKLREVDAKVEEEEMVQTNFKGARILVAEDDALNARALSISLESLGCQVEIAENGKELLDRAQSMPDLIIMDYHMPLMNGETAIRLLKGNEHLRSIPVVVTTGDVFTDSLDKLMAAGADDHILKPIESLPLAKVLSRHIGAARIFSINSSQENINLG